MKEEQKKKPYRSAWSNAMWSFRGMLKEAPLSFVCKIGEVPLRVFLAYAGVYLPSLVVAQVTRQETLANAMIRVGGLILLMFLVEVLLVFADQMAKAYVELYKHKKQVQVYEKSMKLFYQSYEKKETRDLASRAQYATQMWNGSDPLTDMPFRSLKLVENMICYGIFGTMLSFVSPWLVVLVTVTPLVNWFCTKAYRNWEYANREHWTDLDQKLSYVLDASADFKAAKDIRIYGLAGWFLDVFRDLSSKLEFWEQKRFHRSLWSRIPELLVILVRDGAAYGVLIHMTLQGQLPVEQFVLYFSAVSVFATYVGNVMEEWNIMHGASLKICDYREYMDMKDAEESGTESIEPHLMCGPEITFDHVSFRYEDAKEDTLKDISVTIKPGEKVALVGLNGAGKTTFVKLLCGLYVPTEGEIRINGIPMNRFSRRDYYRLFSPVFQDIATGFFSLAEIVSGRIGEGVNEKLAEHCLREAGLGAKIDGLPEGIHSKMDKQVHKDGIDLSGGEKQKLMLARALYKDAPVLVLDEPTAALDPIAEHGIYRRYGQMTAHKTSVFISHRLASTQFCDRILYLHEGKLTEEGTHEELATRGGEYSRLYEMQSCWYRSDYTGGETT